MTPFLRILQSARPLSLSWEPGGGGAEVLGPRRRVHARERAEMAVGGEDVEEGGGRLEILAHRGLPLSCEVENHPGGIPLTVTL